jgi:hypothetical protein
MANTAKSDAYKHAKELKTRRLTKAKQEQLHEWHLMKEMGDALGLDVPKPITNNPLDKRQNTRIAITPGLTVTLSVRRETYDLPSHFIFESKSMMRFTAVMDAEKAARAEGFQVLCCISAESEPKHTEQPLHLSIARRALSEARSRL